MTKSFLIRVPRHLRRSGRPMTFSPRFTITPAVSRDLERIAEAKL